jgi:hypothetical protein
MAQLLCAKLRKAHSCHVASLPTASHPVHESGASIGFIDASLAAKAISTNYMLILMPQ